MTGLGTNVGTSFSLAARMNGFPTIGGTQVPTWFFSPLQSFKGFMGDREVPSVHIEPIEGQRIDLEFTNTSGMEHTIHLHGLDVDQRHDGVPQTSFALQTGDSFTYKFTAPHAGTYMYHCHVDTVIHFAKGMYGAVIVRPPDGSTDKAWTGGPTFDTEVLWHLHTIDTQWNNSQIVSGPGTARHHPDIFMINGNATAEALLDPYTQIVVGAGQNAYLRLLNADYHWARVSLGGLPFQVVASDGRPLQAPVTAGTWEIGPGERYDLLISPTTATTLNAQVDYLDDASGAVLGSAQTSILVT
jgi:FtsP/CotA-like multicopper oxidase with cupredoxin domain